MYGKFTYIWVILLGQMLVNIPAPWSIWVWYLASKKASRTEIHCRIQQHLPQRGGNAPWVDFGWELVWDRKLNMLQHVQNIYFIHLQLQKPQQKQVVFFYFTRQHWMQPAAHLREHSKWSQSSLIGVSTMTSWPRIDIYLVGGFNLPLWNMMELVSWDYDIPNWLGSHKIHVPNHQSDYGIISYSVMIWS